MPLKPGLEVNMPEGIKKLPVDPVRGFPVPAFVAWVEGKPEFRLMNPEHMDRCITQRLCWVCGEKFTGGIGKTFVIGPMCGINRISSEPPSHKECAVYSVLHCPFLNNPDMDRREGGLPKTASSPGVMLKRNPGVTLLWTTMGFHTHWYKKGPLFEILGTPVEMLWYSRGRLATREEVKDSVESGLPSLREICNSEPTEKKKQDALKKIQEAKERLERFYPKA